MKVSMYKDLVLQQMLINRYIKLLYSLLESIVYARNNFVIFVDVQGEKTYSKSLMETNGSHLYDMYCTQKYQMNDRFNFDVL